MKNTQRVKISKDAVERMMKIAANGREAVRSARRARADMRANTQLDNANLVTQSNKEYYQAPGRVWHTGTGQRKVR